MPKPAAECKAKQTFTFQDHEIGGQTLLFVDGHYLKFSLEKSISQIVECDRCVGKKINCTLIPLLGHRPLPTGEIAISQAEYEQLRTMLNKHERELLGSSAPEVSENRIKHEAVHRLYGNDIQGEIFVVRGITWPKYERQGKDRKELFEDYLNAGREIYGSLASRLEIV